MTIETGYTYEATAVQYGAYDAYVNGKLVHSNTGKKNVEVKWAYSTPEATDYVIQAGDKLLVRNGALNINYYTIAAAPAVNEFTDDNGNVFTWSFSPYTGLLSIGVKEIKVGADAKNTTVKITFADAEAGNSAAIIAAAYNGDNMIGNVVMGAGEATIAPVSGATKYVGYVWNGIEGLAPIAASITVNAQ